MASLRDAGLGEMKVVLLYGRKGKTKEGMMELEQT
jgi:hypothetical protein